MGSSVEDRSNRDTRMGQVTSNRDQSIHTLRDLLISHNTVHESYLFIGYRYYLSRGISTPTLVYSWNNCDISSQIHNPSEGAIVCLTNRKGMPLVLRQALLSPPVVTLHISSQTRYPGSGVTLILKTMEGCLAHDQPRKVPGLPAIN